MKNNKVYIFTAFILISALFGVFYLTSISAQTDAQTANQPNATTEDFMSVGQNVEVKAGEVKGDVAVAGANVKISGKVQGYLMAAGANVNVDAPIGNDLWVAGANVIVTQPVSDNVILAGSSVVLGPDATIGKDVRIAANMVEVKSRVARNLKIAAATAQISSEVGGDMDVAAEKLTLAPGAVVRGNLTVNSPNEPVISPQAQVFGRVDYHKTEGRESSTATNAGNWFGNWFLNFLWLTVLGLFAVKFSSVWTSHVAEKLQTETWKSLLVGFLTALIVPFAFVILLVTVVGLPLAFVVGAFALVAFMLSAVFVDYLVGDWFLKQIKHWETSNVLKIVFGTLLVTIVISLPWIGVLAKLAVMFFGVGAFLLERRDLFRQMRAQGLA